MVAKVRFERNRRGFREILRAHETQVVVDAEGDAMVARLGEGFRYKRDPGKRVRGRVYAESAAAKVRQSEEHCLEREAGTPS